MGAIQRSGSLSGKTVAVSLEGVIVAHPEERLDVIASNLRFSHDRLVVIWEELLRDALLHGKAIESTEALRKSGARIVLVAAYQGWIDTLKSRYGWLAGFNETCAVADYRAPRDGTRFLDALATRIGSNDFVFVDADSRIVENVRSRGHVAVHALGLWLNELLPILNGERPRRRIHAA
jgi:hypothetical protein